MLLGRKPHPGPPFPISPLVFVWKEKGCVWLRGPPGLPWPAPSPACLDLDFRMLSRASRATLWSVGKLRLKGGALISW